MKADLWLFALFGLANASALLKRQEETVSATSFDGPPSKGPSKGEKPWKPKTSHPEFFSLKVDEKCTGDEDPDDVDATSSCYFENYAIRLERGIVIATPYNKWWDPKLPIFFVDDDTKLYTVSLSATIFLSKMGNRVLMATSGQQEAFTALY